MTKPKLISISGSVHSGKTTISRLLALELRNFIYLDGDGIAAVVKRDKSWESLDKILPEIHAEILRFLKSNLENGNDVILDYPITDATRQYFINGLKSIKYNARWFLLKPDIKKVLAGSKTRPQLNDWEIERIKYHYKSPLMKTKLATIIDSTDQTPEETFKQILRYIKETE
ncbi:AAA family ATPase [Candidatus Saccharibacteria bacterium]|nr:AAA family ATPase [Candidatus Saccharibacteria bacterium]